MMKRFGTLYRFELYKIIHSKLTVSVLLIFSALAIIMGLQLSKGSQELEIYNQVRLLNGQAINDELVDKMNREIGSVEGLEEKQNYQYINLSHVVLLTSDSDGLITASQFYRNRLKFQKESMKEYKLSDEERQWWAEKEENVQKPITYVSSLNAKTFIEYMTNVSIMSVLLTAICLSGIFAGEYRRNTDQILFSCQYGHREMFLAKLAAGISFSVVWTFILILLLAVSMRIRTGFDGLDGAIQLEVPYSAYPLTFSQYVCIQFVIIGVAAVMFSAMSMALSVVLKNGVAVMGIMTGLYLMSQLLEVPSRFLVISQMIEMMPTNLITLYSLGNFRLFKLLGNYHTMYEVAPFVYLICTFVFLVAAGVAYRKSAR